MEFLVTKRTRRRKGHIINEDILDKSVHQSVGRELTTFGQGNNSLNSTINTTVIKVG